MPKSFWREAREIFDEEITLGELTDPEGAGIRLKRFVLLIREIYRCITRDNVLTVANALAFKTLVAMVPVLAICLSIVAIFESPQIKADKLGPVAISDSTEPSAEEDGKVVSESVAAEAPVTEGEESGEDIASAANESDEGDEETMNEENAGNLSEQLRSSARESFLKALMDRIPSFAGKEEFVSSVHKFADNARAIAGVSIMFLFATVYSLLASIEDSLNRIWQVNRPRKFLARLTAYLGTILIVPALMSLSVALSVFIATHLGIEGGMVGRVFAYSGSILVTVVALTALICFLPNTPVRLRSALLGGFIGGVGLELAKVGFQFFALYVGGNYTKIYGPLLAFPFLLLWLLLAWSIVLISAEVAFVAQNFSDLAARAEMEKRGIRGRLYLASRIVMAASVRHHQGVDPENLVESVAEELGMPPYMVRRMVQDLVEGGILRQTLQGREGYLPAKDISCLTLAEVVNAVNGDQLEVPPSRKTDALRDELAEIFGRAYTGSDTVLRDYTFARLVQMRDSLPPDGGIADNSENG